MFLVIQYSFFIFKSNCLNGFVKNLLLRNHKEIVANVAFNEEYLEWSIVFMFFGFVFLMRNLS